MLDLDFQRKTEIYSIYSISVQIFGLQSIKKALPKFGWGMIK